MTPDDPRHGTANGYQRGCRCDKCRRAKADQLADYRKRRYVSRGQLSMPNLGAVRRLQALSALGWSMSSLATQLGMTSCRVYHLRSGIHPAVYATTHRKIGDLYERLCMTLPPDTSATRRARAHAARLGWFPPLAWDNIDDPGEYPGLGVLAEADAA